jgi:hypothetical protein
MKARLASFALLFVFMAIGACATQQGPLLPHAALAPDGVNFSGTWVIREEESAGQRSINRAASQVGGSGRQSSSRRGSGSGQVQVFLETGRKLKITQTEHGFFVSLDRSVVEEFRFGESRIISIGKIEAQRVSGWDGSVYTVQTRDKNGMKMIDRYWLNDDKNVLLREITFIGRNGTDAAVQQFFDRTN